jgi:hypothetical protein
MAAVVRILGSVCRVWLMGAPGAGKVLLSLWLAVRSRMKGLDTIFATGLLFITKGRAGIKGTLTF